MIDKTEFKSVQDKIVEIVIPFHSQFASCKPGNNLLVRMFKVVLKQHGFKVEEFRKDVFYLGEKLDLDFDRMDKIYILDDNVILTISDLKKEETVEEHKNVSEIISELTGIPLIHINFGPYPSNYGDNCTYSMHDYYPEGKWGTAIIPSEIKIPSSIAVKYTKTHKCVLEIINCIKDGILPKKFTFTTVRKTQQINISFHKSDISRALTLMKEQGKLTLYNNGRSSKWEVVDSKLNEAII